MCLWRARAIALDSLGLSNKAGIVTGRGGASCKIEQDKCIYRQGSQKCCYYIYSNPNPDSLYNINIFNYYLTTSKYDNSQHLRICYDKRVQYDYASDRVACFPV